ncbi:MAG: SDR family NAD(P)-dependent oxidoreductase [Polaromonas sp.]|nr:SDR family NAD(P)-dependent oxidoreductase [Polaromonas sp.]
MTDLRGLVILITGGASGIGAATARALKAKGAVAVLIDCDAAQLKATATALNAPSFCVDVTDPVACESAVAQTLALHGRIDVVWANAGIASFGPLLLTDLNAWKRCVEVNVFGTLNIVRAALPAVIAQRGYVLATASVSSFAHPPAVSSYAASKAAVEAMCNCWRIELAAHGVGVGTIYASWVQTPLVTEGDMLPAFVRLKSTMPAPMRRAMPVSQAADMIVDGIQRRARRIWVPGWVRLLHWLRAALHTSLAERDLLQAAPEMEKLFEQTIATSGVKASSVAPRELAREQSG